MSIVTHEPKIVNAGFTPLAEVTKVWETPVVDEATPEEIYQHAKAVFTENSSLIPDSLTRRGSTLIARWNLRGRYADHLSQWYQDDCIREMLAAFGLSFMLIKSNIDQHKHLRVWCSIGG